MHSGQAQLAFVEIKKLPLIRYKRKFALVAIGPAMEVTAKPPGIATTAGNFIAAMPADVVKGSDTPVIAADNEQ